MGGRGSRSRFGNSARDFYDRYDRGSKESSARAEAYLGVGNGGANDKWIESLTEYEVNAIKTYIEGDYTSINKALRGELSDATSQEIGRIIDGALKKQVIGKDIVLHRGDSGAVFGVKGLDPSDMYDKLSSLTGSSFSYNNIVSTSTTRPFIDEVQYHISVKKGSARGGYINNLSAFNEKEVLLHSKTRFRIDKVEKGDGTNGAAVEVYLSVI